MQALLFYLIFVKSQGPFTENSYIFLQRVPLIPRFFAAPPLFFPLHSLSFVLYYHPTGFHTLSKRRARRSFGPGRSLNKKWEDITMKKFTVQHLATAAAVGAVYAVLSIFGSVFGVTFGTVQCRFAEALCVLPFFFPETVWGLFVGCLITNLLSPYGLLDIVMGSLTTLLAAFLTSRCKNRWLAPLPPVVCNGILVGGMLAWEQVGFTGAFGVTFALNAASVALGELIACYGLGSLLLWRLPKMPFFKNRMK